MKLSGLVLLIAAAAAPSSQAAVIDFGEGPGAPSICSATSDGLGAFVACSNYGFLSQSHGDVAGIVDVSYSQPRLAGATSLRWWASDYNTLYGVAWADGGDANSQARIELKPLVAGSLVTLNGFDLGAWFRTTMHTTVNVYELGGGPALFSFSGNVGNGSIAPTHFSPNVSSSKGLWIEFQDSAYNVGIDHIDYSVGVIPEPSTWLLTIAGFAALGIVARRRRSA